MTGGGMEIWAAILIALAVVMSMARLALWRRSQPDGSRGPSWRFAALVALQVPAGLLLHLTLFPPPVGISPGRLVIATQDAPLRLSGSQDVLVALPEAGPLPGAIRVPDLGSALRMHPEAGRLLIIGQGLTPRDQIPLDRPATFAPTPAPAGLVALTFPGPLAPGARFTVAGQIGTLSSGMVELLDPAGALVDKGQVVAGGRFVLSGAARAAGLALFELRLKDASGRQIERIEIPVETRVQRQPRVLVLAGAANAEAKYLRRWAQDAGVDLSLEIDVGGGVSLGDPPTPLVPAALKALDLVVVDDRRWETLSGAEKAALDAAAQDGLGLLLRPGGPLPASTRRDWANLGMATTGGETVRAVRLDGSTLPPTLQLNSLDLAAAGPGGAPVIRDTSGAVLATWRPRGQGRVGLLSLADSYALTLAGHADRHAELWGELFSTLARPGPGLESRPADLSRAGQRAALCPVRGQILVIDPEGRESRPRPDPATSPAACAAYWPRVSGWHTISSDGAEGAFYVHPAEAAPSLAQAANRQATLDLIQAAVARPAPQASSARGSPWPWAASLLAVLALLWWLERRSPRQGQ